MGNAVPDSWLWLQRLRMQLVTHEYDSPCLLVQLFSCIHLLHYINKEAEAPKTPLQQLAFDLSPFPLPEVSVFHSFHKFQGWRAT
jgi:hypothetical protein